MSDSNPFTGEPGPELSDPNGAPISDGQPNETYAPEEPPRTYLDLDDDLAERYVRVKVDGQDVEVPLREALSGYSRTADYTRKTQELAQQRAEAEYALSVQRALQTHPQEALGLLARQYGVNFEQSQPVQAAPSYDDGYDDPYADPVERRLAQIEQQNQALQQQWQQRQADEELRVAIAGLQSRYGVDDSVVREVVGRTLQMGLGPQAFDMVYKNVAYDRAMAARAAAEQQRQQLGQQRQGARQTAQALVGSEASLNGGGAPAPVPAGANLTIAEAFDLAMQDRRVE